MAFATLVLPGRERRFLLTRDGFLATARERLTAEVYDRTRPVAYARTTYLDTDDHLFFRSCDGPVVRRLRIREYAAARDVDDRPIFGDAVWLELKESVGPRRKKLRVPLPAGLLDRLRRSGADWRQLLLELPAATPIRDRLPTQPLAPRVATWYRRSSFAGASGRLRVTVDEAIRFCEPFDHDRVLGLGPSRLLEVKHRGEPPAWLRQELGGLDEVTEFSKFQAAMQLI